MIEILTNINLLSDFFATSLRLSVPLVFATLGGVVSERSGVYNIGLEGMILAGAFGSALGAFIAGSPYIGLICGFFLGALTGALLSLLAVSLGVNQIVSGLAINLLMIGLTAFLSRIAFGGQANTKPVIGFDQITIPFINKIPVFGTAFFDQDILVYFMYFLVVFMFIIMKYTPWGLNIRAVGENPRAADVAGLNVNKIRFLSVTVSGAFAGLGGSYLVLSQVKVFSEHMSAGKGFVALAAIILARWNPLGALAACLFFGVCDALQLRLQFSNPDVPYQIFTIIPYAASILALIGIGRKVLAPASVGIHYEKETET